MFSVSAQEFRGADAARTVNGAEHVWLKPHNKLPSFVRFAPNRHIPRVQFDNFVKENMGLQSQDGWAFLREHTDQLGHHHERFQQTYQGYPVEGSMIIIHSENGKVYAMNGDFFKFPQVSVDAKLKEKEALKHALDHIDANAYKWELIREESHLQDLKRGNSDKTGPYTYFPEGELVIAPLAGDFKGQEYRLAWKFDIYAHAPLSRHDVFVDAVTGEILFKLNMIHTVDVVGSAVTAYSGTRVITADSVSGGFFLRENGRGNGIYTWNMQNDDNTANRVDFADGDNVWNNVNANLDQFATDAHWGAEATYDFFFNNYGRNSINNNGYRLNQHVHYGARNFTNAFWDGTMNYGDATNSPFTTLDITAHEITHGLTSFSANLIYQNEMGALNESFSDIFAKAVEQAARPNDFSWRVGDDLSIGAIRNMANPAAFNDPRNYLGQRWFTGAGDNGGVHINSGVQNHWYYLLCEGDSGTNDFNESYQVAKIGFDTANAVAFRNLTVYLTRTSEYEDARFYSIESAIDLYGKCSNPRDAVEDAWHAVGIGRPFSTIPISDFSSAVTELCSQPYEIDFFDLTQGATSLHWNFGDGDTSNLINPTHTYANPGVYNVSLSIVGVCGGVDTLQKNSFITLNPSPVSPTVNQSAVALNCLGNAQFVATAQDKLEWLDQNDNVIATTDTLNLTQVTSSVTYYARNIDESSPQNVGAIDPDSVGGGGFFNAGNFQGLVFDVFGDVRLKSVWVNANTAGTRDVILRDQNGNVLQSVTVNMPAGKSRVTLDMDLEAGSYQLGGVNMDLFRNNNGGTNYPYLLQNAVSINTATAGNNFYYFYYDWEVTTICRSGKVPVNITVNPISPPTLSQSSLTIPCGSTDSITATATNKVSWYDANDNLISTGGTFNIPPITSNTTFYARNETGSAPIFGGPATNNIGGGGFFGSDARWLVFNVNQASQLKSVLVYAGSAGPRTIEYRDAGGNIQASTTVNLPAGQSRVALNFPLTPGNNQILAVSGNADLYRNNAGVNYPYNIGTYVTITASNANNPGNFYYFFYDWEVSEPGCSSVKVPLTVNVTPLASPTVAPATICYDDPATLTASSASASWYNTSGNLVGVGKTFTTPNLTNTTNYFVRAESLEPLQNVGPLNGTSVGGGGYHDQAFDARLLFDVLSPIRLNSVWVDAGSAGTRDIILEDAGGNVIQTFTVNIPAGISRVTLGAELQTGSYAIGGTNMDLFRNNNGPSYPYEIPGLVSITGSNAGTDFYYYLYDWEVQGLPCTSNQVAVPVTVLPQIPTSFVYTLSGTDFNFQDVTPVGTSWMWDFGDGNTSSMQNPTHSYAAAGTYTVTLTVTVGPCSSSFTQNVTIDRGTAIDDVLTDGSFQLFPNPGNGRFRVQATALQSSDMQVVVYDMTGREVFASDIIRATELDQEINLHHMAVGTYFVQLRIGAEQVMQKYVLMK
jgi:Zn-dependent metalloprotease